MAGSRYWSKLWWDNSINSSIWMPEWRKNLMTAQVFSFSGALRM